MLVLFVVLPANCRGSVWDPIHLNMELTRLPSTLALALALALAFLSTAHHCAASESIIGKYHERTESTRDATTTSVLFW